MFAHFGLPLVEQLAVPDPDCRVAQVRHSMVIGQVLHTAVAAQPVLRTQHHRRGNILLLALCHDQ